MDLTVGHGKGVHHYVSDTHLGDNENGNWQILTFVSWRVLCFF